MKIISWNINSVRMRIENLKEIIRDVNPDIILLQEIKCENDKFPHDELSEFNYNIYVNGQKSYNGVAILSKFSADEIIIQDFCANHSRLLGDQARFIETSMQTPIGYINIASLYAPNGGEYDSDKFKMKIAFYNEFIKYISKKNILGDKFIVGGDFNIAPFDIDVYSPELLKDNVCFTDVEKKLFRTILNSGYNDLYRLIYPINKEFSWWDYRGNSFEKNKGMRIDMILANDNLINHVVDSSMLHNERAKDKPSDHAPILTIMK